MKATNEKAFKVYIRETMAKGGLAASISDDFLKAQYVKNRRFDDDHYKTMIIEYLKKYGLANRKEIDSLLLTMLPDVLNEKQKKNKISNLLGSLRNSNKIRNSGTTNKPRYQLS
jgi:ATP-dependent DNA helicase RecG